MAVRTISTKLAIQGEQEYKQKIAQVNSSLKTLDSELKLVESQFAGQANTLEALTAKGNVLNKMQEAQANKVSELRNALTNAAQAQKTYADRIEDARNKMASAETALRGLESQTGDTTEEQKKLTTELNRLQKELDDATAGEAAATKGLNSWQQQVNTAEAKLNNLNATIRQNDQYMGEAKRSSDGLATSIDGFGKKSADATEKAGLLGKIFKAGFFANLATQAVTALVNTIKQLVSSAMQAADELSKMSAVTGKSAEELQRLQYIGDDLGVSLDTITSAQMKLTRAMQSAQDGTEKASDSFDKLGVQVTNADGSLRNANTVMAEAFEALSMVGNETERDAIAMDLFGRSAMELNPLIKAGSEELARLGAEADNVGAVMDERVIKILDAAGDAMDHFGQVVKAMAGSAAAALLVLFGVAKVEATEYASFAEEEGKKSTENIIGAIDQLTKSYEDAYDAANKSIESQLGLWNKMDNSVKMSVDELSNTLSSQLTWMYNYEANLNNLENRQIEGVDLLVRKLSDGTKESAAALAGLADATDEEISRVVYQMGKIEEGKDVLSKNMAEAVTDYSGAMGRLTTVAMNNVNEMNFAAQAGWAGTETMNAYIRAINAKIPELEQAYSRAGQAGYNALFRVSASNVPTTAQPGSTQSGNTSNLVAQIMEGLKLNINTNVNIDGRKVASATGPYMPSVNDLIGNNLVNGG